MSNPQELRAKADAAVETARTNSRRLVYVGATLAVVAFLLPWWGLTKYRVREFRGVVVSDMTMRGEFQAYPPPKEVTEGMDPEDVAELRQRTQAYSVGWEANKSLNKDFYYKMLGDGYERTLLDKETMSLSSGGLSAYGWSTWTGWFGILFIVAGVAAAVLPSFMPQFAPWAWLAPWCWALFGGIYLLAALAFYFGVPDENGDGYSQGVSFGGYLAILAGAAVTIGGVFEGIKSARERLTALEATADEEEEDVDEPEAEAKVARPAKAPVAPVVDPDEERRKRLTDW